MKKIACKLCFFVDPNVKAGTYLKRKHTIYVRKHVCTLRRLVPFIFTQTFFEKQEIHFRIRQILWFEKKYFDVRVNIDPLLFSIP